MEKVTQAGCSGCCRLVTTEGSSTEVALAMEFVDGQNLLQKLSHGGMWDEERARPFVRQILQSLADLHRIGVLHRDIKCENIMVTRGDRARLIDFGLSVLIPNEGLTGDVGSTGYQSPECLTGHPYGADADMWSLGAVVYSILTGVPAFYQSPRHSANDMILNSPVTEILGKRWAAHLSPSALDFISRLLDRNQVARMTAEQALSHPWLQSNNDFRNFGAPKGVSSYMNRGAHFTSSALRVF